MKFSIKYMVFIFFFACTKGSDDNSQKNKSDSLFTKEMSIEANKYFIKDESFEIDRFCIRHKWPVIKTETGIRYYIYESGKGRIAEPGKWATIDYEVRLLDSDTTLCYSSSQNGPMEFLIEMDKIESGLHEAVSYLRKGDRAFIILPHYLAHGLVGNLDKIPPLSPVLYNIHLLDVEDKKF